MLYINQLRTPRVASTALRQGSGIRRQGDALRLNAQLLPAITHHRVTLTGTTIALADATYE